MELTTFPVRDLITELLEPLWQEGSKFLIISGGSRGRARGAALPPPLFLDRTDAQRAEKIGGEGRPALSLAAPPPTLLSQGLDPALIIITP